ncbi:PREDICTED: lymphotactin-like [Cercocebus atys]|uniref:lymphotactin-like n=1 Tax=Cercocebus atys TaxID=9531 RepID=UPI0005F46BE5|nr:PREDICTED: lymphotactin-like [Cercocebus atys]
MIPHPPQKPPLTTGSALTIGGIKEVLKEPDPHSLLAQLSRTSAMRLLTLALLGICCLTAYIVEGVGSEVSDKSTCVSLTTQRLPVNRIKTYTIKEGSLKAVIFITKRGLKVCADPQARWVKDVVKSMDRKSNTRNNMIQTKPTGTQQSTNTAVTLTG